MTTSVDASDKQTFKGDGSDNLGFMAVTTLVFGSDNLE